MQRNPLLGRLPIVHGSHPVHDFGRRARRGADLLDVVLLTLPVLLAVVAFVVGNLL